MLADIARHLDVGKRVVAERPKRHVSREAFPEVDERALVLDEVEIVLQVNGKIRSKLVVATDADEATVRQMALEDERVKEHLSGRDPKKVIYVPKKLVNVVG